MPQGAFFAAEGKLALAPGCEDMDVCCGKGLHFFLFLHVDTIWIPFKFTGDLAVVGET